jgi:hypothetical protein
MTNISEIFSKKSETDSCLEHKHHSCNHINPIAGISLILLFVSLSICTVALVKQATTPVVAEINPISRLAPKAAVLGASTQNPQIAASQFLAVHDFIFQNNQWTATLEYINPSQDNFSLVKYLITDGKRGNLEVVEKSFKGQGKITVSLASKEVWEYVLTNKPNGKGEEQDHLLVAAP